MINFGWYSKNFNVIEGHFLHLIEYKLGNLLLKFWNITSIIESSILARFNFYKL